MIDPAHKAENDGFARAQRDGLKWLHLTLVVVVAQIVANAFAGVQPSRNAK